MKRSRFTERQIAFALQQAEAGTPVPEDGGHRTDLLPMEEEVWRVDAL